MNPGRNRSPVDCFFGNIEITEKRYKNIKNIREKYNDWVNR
jgi:hypothetical protein